jgi:hypothetical protein
LDFSPQKQRILNIIFYLPVHHKSPQDAMNRAGGVAQEVEFLPREKKP